MYADDSKVIAEVNESTLQLDTSEMVDVQQMQNNVLMKWGKKCLRKNYYIENEGNKYG
jgi:hypothetical protein